MNKYRCILELENVVLFWKLKPMKWNGEKKTHLRWPILSRIFKCTWKFDYVKQIESKRYVVFAEINAHPEIIAHQKRWFFKGGGSTQNRWVFDGWIFKGGSTQNRWVLMDDFSKGGVHKTDGFLMGDFSKRRVHKTDGLWWVIFQRGEFTKPTDSDGVWNVFYCF